MTNEEYLAKLKSLADVSKQSLLDRIIMPAANELLAETKNRIIVDGKGSSGNTIGNYSTRPGYYSREQFDKKSSFKNLGKTGNKTKSTMYLPAGYKQLRDIQGKPTDKINENYTGDTILAYQLGQETNAVVLGFTTERASKIRKGQEKKFGKIFSQTPQEMEQYQKNVVADVIELSKSILNA